MPLYIQTAVKEVSITVRYKSSVKYSVKHSAIKMNINALIDANLIAVVHRINRQLDYRFSVNPFTDEQLNLLGTVPKRAYHSSSLYIFCLECKIYKVK